MAPSPPPPSIPPPLPRHANQQRCTTVLPRWLPILTLQGDTSIGLRPRLTLEPAQRSKICGDLVRQIIEYVEASQTSSPASLSCIQKAKVKSNWLTKMSLASSSEHDLKLPPKISVQCSQQCPKLHSDTKGRHGSQTLKTTHGSANLYEVAT